MIKIFVTNSSVMPVVTEPVTTGSVGRSVLFSFAEDWAEYPVKIAVWQAGEVTKDRKIVGNGEVWSDIPPEVLQKEGGKLTVGIYGATGEEEPARATPTIIGYVAEISAGADPSGDEGLGADLPLWAQAMETLAQTQAVAESVRSAAEAGEFDGADGKSAYQIAVDNGFEGTEEEWLESLKGSGSSGQSFNIGDGLKLDAETNTLSVETATEVEADNMKPITSAAVYTTVGNIEILLGTI